MCAGEREREDWKIAVSLVDMCILHIQIKGRPGTPNQDSQCRRFPVRLFTLPRVGVGQVSKWDVVDKQGVYEAVGLFLDCNSQEMPGSERKSMFKISPDGHFP